ncbi:hypothetical protein [Paraburkholderia lycopersici]|nr:hypothetical protein [Paraburkholderia lycopersici]
MKNVKWNPDNPFIPLLATAQEVKDFVAAGGYACIESKIENVFGQRLGALKEKIRRLRAIKVGDEFTGNLLVDSILVDCRALFLENERHRRNSTLQNVYRARQMKEKADRVDELLATKVSFEKTVRDVIKAWVDQRVVHIDWLWDEEEDRIFEDVKTFLFNSETGGLLSLLDTLIEDYEFVKSTFGANAREQTDLVFEALTGGRESVGE